MDFNSHMKNTAFLDRSADLRMMYFAEKGFPVEEFRKLRIGPVIMSDEVRYFRELQLLERFSVSLELAGMSEDGSRYKLMTTITNRENTVCATIVSVGGWLDLEKRKLIAPPSSLLEAVKTLERPLDFTQLPSSINRKKE